MKRAEVYKARNVGLWGVCVWHGEPPTRHLPIPERDDSGDHRGGEWVWSSTYHTHAEALAHALESVGLTTPPEHKEPS